MNPIPSTVGPIGIPFVELSYNSYHQRVDVHPLHQSTELFLLFFVPSKSAIKLDMSICPYLAQCLLRKKMSSNLFLVFCCSNKRKFLSNPVIEASKQHGNNQIGGFNAVCMAVINPLAKNCSQLYLVFLTTGLLLFWSFLLHWRIAFWFSKRCALNFSVFALTANVLFSPCCGPKDQNTQAKNMALVFVLGWSFFRKSLCFFCLFLLLRSDKGIRIGFYS